jgi:hypothetical protein
VGAGQVSLRASGNQLPDCTTTLPGFLACVRPKVETGPLVFQEDCCALFTGRVGRHRTNIINKPLTV